METKSLRPLALAFAAGGIWDTAAGMMYIFLIGTGRAIDNPPVDPFYAIFTGSFFLCFAYLQILSSMDIKRYLLNVGCLVSGRLFYVGLLCGFMLFVPGFPSTFWFTGIIDGVLTVLYILFALKAGVSLKQLFVPGPRYHQQGRITAGAAGSDSAPTLHQPVIPNATQWSKKSPS